MAPQKFEYFFDLPPELREQILGHICLFPTGILVGGGVDGGSIPLPVSVSAANTTAGTGDGTSSSTRSTSHSFTPTTTNRRTGGYYHDESGGTEEEDNDDDDEENDEPSANPPLNLFLASPILYRDAGELYYARNVFHLDLASSSRWGRKRMRQRGRAAAAAAARGDDNGGRRRRGITTTTGHHLHHHHQQQQQQSLDLGVQWDCSSGGGGDPDPLIRLLAQPDTAGARRRIRSVAVSLRRLGALVLDVLVPALGDMVLNGALRRVRVDVLEAGSSNSRVAVTLGERRRRGMVNHEGNPALRALLVVLTDPDMERAELRVPRWGHAPFWCRFHRGDGGSEDGGGGGSGCGMSGRPGGGGEFVEVDIQRLVQACAGDAAEFRIKKVGFG